MPSFSNPVVGAIKPFGSPAVFGSFRVTAPFGAIDADHPTAHQGVDIGNMKCGDPILAMSDGIVAEAFTAAKGAIIVRVSSTEFPGYEFAAAHCAGIEVVKGQKLKRGQVYAHIGKTGTTACHLHSGLKLNGVEIDSWPLLAQNQQEGDDLDASFSPKANRTVTVNKGTRHRTSPSTTEPGNIAIASDPGGALGFPLLGTVVGEAVAGNTIWYAYWRPETHKVYYIHTSACGPETPFEATAGHSDAELADARSTAAADAAAAVSAAAATKAAQFGSKKT